MRNHSKKTLVNRFSLICVGVLFSQSCGHQPAVPYTPMAGVGTSHSSPTTSGQSPVIVQLFNWPFKSIELELPILKTMGYTDIHVSPPQLSLDIPQRWGRYQPLDYRVIDGPLGNENEFKSLNQKAQELGLRIVADVVLNHMASPGLTGGLGMATANQNARQDSALAPWTGELTFPPLNLARQYQLKEPLFRSENFHHEGCVQDWENREQLLSFRLCDARVPEGLPDLNQNDPYVLKTQRDYLEKLLGLGVQGFRFDAVKHMPPDYFAKLLHGFDVPGLLFGEIIANRWTFDRDLAPYLNGATPSSLRFYDFPLLLTMGQALGYGGDLRTLKNPAANKAALPEGRAITLVMNHDLPTNGMTFKYLMQADHRDEMLAYSFIFAREDGIPYVYSDLGRNEAQEIMLDQYKNAHRMPLLRELIAFRSRVQGEPEAWFLTSQNQIGFLRGRRALWVLNKTASPFALTTKVDLEDGLYQNRIEGYFSKGTEPHLITITGGNLSITIPPRAAVILEKNPL